VRETADTGKSLEALSATDLRRYSRAFGPRAVALLKPENSIRRRRVIGGPAPSQVRRRLRELEDR
jgi:argininosuccinate lyase